MATATLPRLSGEQLLASMELDLEARCLRLKPTATGFQRRGARGNVVPIVEPADGGTPYVQLGRHKYDAKALVRAIRKQDPALVDGTPLVYRSRTTARDAEMWELAKTGVPYADIGARYGGLSRQRVKQILDRLIATGHDPVNPRAIRHEQRAAVVDASRQAAAMERWGTHERPEERLVQRMRNVKRRAIARGVEFSIAAADLHPLPTHCPALGIPLVYESDRGRGAWDDSPSIDRIIPSKGYVPGNVVIISQRANRIKNDATIDELRAIVELYGKLIGS